MTSWIYHQQQLSRSAPVTHLWFYFNDPSSSFIVRLINTEQSILVNVTLITNRSHYRLHGHRASRLEFVIGLEFVMERLEAKRILFLFFFFFPPLSSGVTLSSPQAMQEDCSAHGKWLANPEPKQIPDRADVADCHSHSKFRWHRWESCACFGFCHLVLYMWICRLRCCKTYLQTPEWNLLKAALSIIHPRI